MAGLQAHVTPWPALPNGELAPTFMLIGPTFTIFSNAGLIPHDAWN